MAKKTKVSKRKFHRTLLTLEILSEEELPNMLGPADIWRECETGAFSGEVVNRQESTVDGPRMAKLLLKQGSDPSFFKLTDKGEDSDDN